MTILFDTETRSHINLKTHGTAKYAANCQCVVMSAARDDGPVQVIDMTDPDAPRWNADIADGLRDPAEQIVAHHAFFDRQVLQRATNLSPQWRALGADTKRWQCSMARANAHGMPSALADIGPVLGVDAAHLKDPRGNELIRLFTTPPPKYASRGWADRITHPKEWAEFLAYARQDIVAMRAIWNAMPSWNWQANEINIYQLDQAINDKGFLVDTDLCTKAIALIYDSREELDAETYEHTGGDVEAATQRDRLLIHILDEYGVDLPDMKKATIERRIADPDLPEALKELLRMRLSASANATSKFKRALKVVNEDGYLRGGLQFSGAKRTRRWAGRMVQPQNFIRPNMKNPAINAAIRVIKSGLGGLVLKDPIKVSANCLRGMIIPPPGCKVVAADLSNIEGRDQAWLCGEAWKLQAFRDYDAGTGEDLYKIAYGRSFGVDPAGLDDGTERQIGKVQELSMGYAGGVAAFVGMAANYRMDISALADAALPVMPQNILAEAEEFYIWWTVEQRKSTYGLSKREFVACEGIKRGWRAANSAISSYWKELEYACINAIQHPGQWFKARMLHAKVDGAWLRIYMPSERVLCFPGVYHDGDKICFMGEDTYTRQWTKQHTYGGKLFENACQSIARDVMADNMQAAVDAGFDVRFTVHDELVAYAPDSAEFSPERLAKILATNPAWCPDMPLSAKGFQAERYCKG